MNFGSTSGAGAKATGGGVGTPVTLAQVQAPTYGLSTEFASNPYTTRMPEYNSAAQQEAARLKTAAIVGRSGRASTDLTSPGISTYSNSVLGGA